MRSHSVQSNHSKYFGHQIFKATFMSLVIVKNGLLVHVRISESSDKLGMIL